LSARRSGRSTGSTTSHCSSVNSQRPAIGACGDTQSIHRMPLFTTGNVYETGSNADVTFGVVGTTLAIFPRLGNSSLPSSGCQLFRTSLR
jgi:hypothetical protein